LVGGAFWTLGGLARTNLGRLLNPGGTTNSLSFDGSSITWLRGGTGPEVWRATFESSTDGTNWSSLGTALRIGGGWQLATNTFAATNSTVRARGFVGSVNSYGSSWYVEQLLVPRLPPAILLQDANFGVHSNLFGFDVRALPGQTVVVETTTDFVNWVALQTNCLSGASTFLFADAASSGFPQRFYRARLQ
jgi:hypothetical protein